MALPEHITGTGTQEDPYILTCWNDLYYITECETNGNFWKFVDGYSEDLTITYPYGNVPEVMLTFNGSRERHLYGTIDFNKAQFINGRFDGFALAGTYNSTDTDILILKNMRFVNFADTGNPTASGYDRHGFMHIYGYDYDSSTSIIDSEIELNGLDKRYSIFLNHPYTDSDYWDERTYYGRNFHVYNSNILLKGYEGLAGGAVTFHDCILTYDSVTLSRAMNVYKSDGSGTERITIEQLITTTYYEAYDRALAICTFYDCLIAGKIISEVEDAKSAFIHKVERSIIDLECDTMFLCEARAPVLVNSDRCPTIQYMDSYYYSYAEEAEGATSEQLIDINFLQEAGYATVKKEG